MNVTEKKRVKLHDGCIDNPIYLCWINPFGGFSYWLFGVRQKRSYKTQDIATTTRYINDIETANAKAEIIQKSANDIYEIGASGLTEQEVNGLITLLHSPKVMMLTNKDEFDTGSAPKWLTIIVSSQTFAIGDTDAHFKEIEFEIVIPKNTMRQ